MNQVKPVTCPSSDPDLSMKKVFSPNAFENRLWEIPPIITSTLVLGGLMAIFVLPRVLGETARALHKRMRAYVR